MPVRPKTHRTHATRIGLLVVAALALGGAWLSGPAPAAASTATTAAAMENQILVSINADRAAGGLISLRRDSRLVTWSADRSAWMASHASLTHTSWGGAPCTLYQNERITWYGCGEAVGDTTATFGTSAASFLYSLWKNSSDHEALIMSASYNYIGIGVSYRAATHTTYASILFLEGPDRSSPVPHYTSQYVSGGRLHWTWTAVDPMLQTHFSGFRNYDVEISVNGAAWRHMRSNSTAVAIATPPERRGTYKVRIRARDNAGNVSAWLNSSTLVVH